MLSILLTESIKKLGLMPGIGNLCGVSNVNGGGWKRDVILWLMILDIVLIEGQSDEENTV